MAKLQRGSPSTKPNKKLAATKSGATTSSRKLVGKQYIVSVHGARGVGKTLLALSASSKAPAAWPPKKGKWSKYADVLWLSFDAGATDTFSSFNIEVDVLSFHELVRGGKDVLQAMKYMSQQAANWASKHPDGIIVADTVTSLGHQLERYWEPKTADGFKKWAAVKASHEMFHEGLTFVAKKVIYLFHTKAIITDEEKAKKVVKATRTPGGVDLVPALSGAGVDAYLNHSSIIIALQAKKAIGGKLVRFCSLGTKDGYEAKNRFSGFLDDEEKPHLGAMLKRIEKGLK